MKSVFDHVQKRSSYVGFYSFAEWWDCTRLYFCLVNLFVLCDGCVVSPTCARILAPLAFFRSRAAFWNMSLQSEMFGVCLLIEVDICFKMEGWIVYRRRAIGCLVC